MGWLIDPEDKLVMVIDAGQRLALIDELSEVLPVPEFGKNIKLTVVDVFGWLKRNKLTK